MIFRCIAVLNLFGSVPSSDASPVATFTATPESTDAAGISQRQDYKVTVSIDQPESSGGRLLCSATTTAEVPSDVETLLEEYRIADKRPFDRWADFPQSYTGFVDPVSGVLYQSILRFTKTVRWRYNIEGSHIPVGSPAFQWSADGETWQALLIDIRIEMTTGWTWKFSFSADSLLETVRVMRHGDQEPVYHELLREARAQGRGNERGALVLAVAAVEWGIKHVI